MIFRGRIGERRALRPIKVHDGEFQIELRYPTFDEMLRDTAMTGSAAWESRINNNVVGWKDVRDENGQPVPFSQDRFAAMCEMLPGVFQQTLVHLSNLYHGLGEDEQKNSATPPASGSAGGEDYEAVSGTGSLN